MKEFVVWEVQKWDGGDRHNHAFYLSSEEEKNKYLKNNKYDAAHKKTITIYDTLDEIAKDSYESAKAKAKESLTGKQRKALGLDF